MAHQLRLRAPFGAAKGSLVTARKTCSVTCSATKLYTNPASRGKFVEWYLQEIGAAADVELVNMDMKAREHKAEPFLEINPFGKVPALVDGETKLFESGAILLYFAEKYGHLATPKARAEASQWTLFANSTMANGLFVEQLREKQLPDLMSTLNKIFEKQPFITGDSFTVSDVAVGGYLLYLPAFFPHIDLSPYPHVQAYLARLTSRPACQATVAARAQQKKAETEAATAAAKNN